MSKAEWQDFYESQREHLEEEFLRKVAPEILADESIDPSTYIDTHLRDEFDDFMWDEFPNWLGGRIDDAYERMREIQ